MYPRGDSLNPCALPRLQAIDTIVADLGSRGIRALAIARTADADMKEFEMVGLLTFLDPPRPDTKRTIERAMEYGVDVKMITGGRRSTGQG